MTKRLRAVAFLLWRLAAGSAAAQEPRSFTVVYDVYTGGLQIVELGIDISVASSRYEVLTRVRTRGVYATCSLGADQPRQRTSQREQGGAAALRAARHIPRQAADRRDRLSDGKVMGVKLEPPPADDNDREPVEHGALLGSVDPLSGIIGVLMRIDRGGDCSGSYEGFDGRRRFSVEFTDRGLEHVEAGRPGGLHRRGARLRLRLSPDRRLRAPRHLGAGSPA